jgi:dsRNA-specific ribonuclease
MVEAFVGAVFIDSDFNYNEVQRFFDGHIKPYFEDMTIYDTFANNHPVVSDTNRVEDILRRANGDMADTSTWYPPRQLWL